MKEIDKLKNQNEVLRKKIDNNLKLYMTSINDEYQDILFWINELIENELEQEKLCNA